MTDEVQEYNKMMATDKGRQLRALAEPYIKLHKADGVIFMDWIANGIVQRYTMHTVKELREFTVDLINIVKDNIALLDQVSDQERDDLALATAVMQGSATVITDFILAHYPEYTWTSQLLDTVHGALSQEADNG